MSDIDPIKVTELRHQLEHQETDGTVSFFSREKDPLDRETRARYMEAICAENHAEFAKKQREVFQKTGYTNNAIGYQQAARETLSKLPPYLDFENPNSADEKLTIALPGQPRKTLLEDVIDVRTGKQHLLQTNSFELK